MTLRARFRSALALLHIMVANDGVKMTENLALVVRALGAVRELGSGSGKKMTDFHVRSLHV